MNNTRTRIKICGLTCPEDARYAAGCGVDAIGLVFYSKSPRSVSIAQAQNILKSLPPLVSSVGLFVDAEIEFVEEVLEAVPLDILQFHGEEDESYCESFKRPYLKAIKVKADTDLASAIKAYPSASGILLDAWHKDLAGGTGESFDWALLDELKQDLPIILAGGINSENVAQAISKVQPFAVDVSSGVESAPGIKSDEKVKQFVDEVMKRGNECLKQK